MGHYNRGTAYSSLGEYQTAIADFTKAIQLDPDSVNAYNNRTSPCRNNVCLQRIDVDRVFGKVCEILARRV